MADAVTELQLFVEIVKAGNLSAAAGLSTRRRGYEHRPTRPLGSHLGVRLVTRPARRHRPADQGLGGAWNVNKLPKF
jgi:hypothetical protein